MKLSIGIVGLPNVGKSTLFKTLTKQDVTIANYPFATIDPNVGVVAVPDERLSKLAELSHSKKVIPAVVEFYDIAGLVKGAYKGEGLGNQFLSHIRETQAIVVVLRVFQNAEIIHIEESIDPLRDLEIINSELMFKDLETVEKRLAKAESETRGGNKDAAALLESLRRIKESLEQGTPLFTLATRDQIYSGILKNIGIDELNLLTAKKQIYLLNGEEGEVNEDLKNRIYNLRSGYIVADLSKSESVPDSTNSPLAQLIKKAYEVLDLISFLTTGEDETRAWTVKKGTLLPQAAGVIHTDFEKKFIRAEVVPWNKLLEAGGWNQAKQKGWIRVEGKEYLIQDGDVIVVRHS